MRTSPFFDALEARRGLLLSWVALAACATPAAPRVVPPPFPAGTAFGDRDPDAGEIEQSSEEDSAELREVHDAEVRREQPRAEPAPPLGEAVWGLPEIEGDLSRLQAKYDIPIDVNGAVVEYVRFFQSAQVRPHFVRWLARLQRYGPRFREILRAHGLPQDTVYLAMVESGFARRATSRARAVGPWQFIAATGKQYGLRQDFWVDERRDPEKAAVAAARFLRALHRETGDWRLAWASYNAGPGRIARARALGYSGFWRMASARNVLPAETRAYVPKIMAAAILAKHAAAFGFAAHEIAPEKWVEYHEVLVRQATDLATLAAAAEVDVAVLLDLNTELRRTWTPPRPYRLKIPREKAQAFAANWRRIARAAPTAVARHRVRRGETIFAIARKYGISATVLADVNQVVPRRLQAGALLVVPLGAGALGGGTAKADPVRATRTMRVGRGDTLWAIARRFGVTVHELARWNGIRDPRRHVLRAGRVIAVTAGGKQLLARDP